MPRNDNFVEFMSSWKSMVPYYAIRIPLYGFFSFYFGSISLEAIVKSWGNANMILTLIVAIGLLAFCVFIVGLATFASITNRGIETKAFGYTWSQEKSVFKEIEKILAEENIDYTKIGPKRNLITFQRYSEVYSMAKWSIKSYSYTSRKGGFYEAEIIEIGPTSVAPSTIKNIKDKLDERLKPFHLGRKYARSS